MLAYYRFCVVIFIFLLFSNISLAEKKANFKDDTIAKEILFDKSWNCSFGDNSGWSGYGIWKFETISKKKVTGSLDIEACYGDSLVEGKYSGGTASGTFNGKLKKDTMKFTANPPPGGVCRTFNGKLKFFLIDGSDEYTAEGKFSRTHNGVPYRGTLYCSVQ